MKMKWAMMGRNNAMACVGDGNRLAITNGICGFATALALHRKEIKSVVFERTKSLRNVTGAAIGIRQNRWLTLDQLGVADILCPIVVPVKRDRSLMLDGGKQKGMPIWMIILLGARAGAGQSALEALQRADCSRESVALRHSSTLKLMKLIEDTIQILMAKIESIVQSMNDNLSAEVIQSNKIDDLKLNSTLLKQLEDLQNELKDNRCIYTSRPYILLKGAGRTPLNLETRSAIALGAAHGITYLHAQRLTISQGNIKSSSILLTTSYEAHVNL
ncbi:aromatic-ring hydroxylase-like protein [Tanacetum coccineum]|uniref:Aromatic-ring hydroxylase-like protein n=1 Tax=Tanacetum coccineum TaxID=301880 RepID=A0ABQ5GGG9_9ASTR